MSAQPQASLPTGPSFWVITLAAAAILMITMGVRMSLGLFVSPINTATGLGIETISLALAIGQFTWGAAQPVAGALADRYGTPVVLVIGIIVMSIGTALTPFVNGALGLALTIGFMASVGSGIGSFSVLIGAVAQRVPAERRGIASGVINAGGSFGQFVFAPLVQRLITWFQWSGALWASALLTLAALPFVAVLRNPRAALASAVVAAPAGGLRGAVKNAFADRSYWLLHAGFFTCGFHIAFLATHLPGEINLCGLPASVASWSLALIGLANVAGSLIAGWCITHVRSKMTLFTLYALRALLIAVYLFLPKTELVFYAFAIGLGLTWLATVPPTAGLVGKLFGTRYLATLFGLTLLSHQTGAFFGAWLGGIALAQQGNYQWMWYADIALAVIAALSNLPIREQKIAPVAFA